MQIKHIQKILLTLLLVLLPFQLNYYVWPRWAFVLGRSVDYLAIPIYATDVLILSVIILGFLTTNKLSLKNQTFFSMPLIIFVSFVVYNIYFSSNPPLTFMSWITVIKFIFLALFIVRTHVTFKHITLTFLAASIWVSFVGIFQSFLGKSLGLYWFGERTFTIDTLGIAKASICLPWQLNSYCVNFLRAYGTFPHPNVMAGFLVFAILLTLAYKKHIISVWSKYLKITHLPTSLNFSNFLYSVVLSFLVFTLFLTFSRTAWISLIVGVLCLTRISFSKKIISFLFALVLLISPTLPFLSHLFSFTESFTVRQQLNQAATTLITQHLLTGVGLGNFLIELPFVLVSRTIYFLQPVHNIYMLFTSETGVLGVLVLLYFLWLLYKQKTTIKLFLILPLLLIGLTDHYLLTLHQGQLLFTVILTSIFIHDNQ